MVRLLYESARLGVGTAQLSSAGGWNLKQNLTVSSHLGVLS